MEPFRVHILGCGSALPTLRHYASSQVVELRGKCFLVDCGEGTQVQLRRSRVNFNRISTIFVSHLHGDHCFGLIGLISTFGLLGRVSPLHIYAPKAFDDILRRQIKFFCDKLEYEIVFHGLNTMTEETVYDDRSLSVSTIPLDHRIPCCGFLFKEKPTLPHIRRDMIDFYGIPEHQRNNIKNGADWITPDGEIIPNSRLTRPSDKVRSYAYCSDTKYMPTLYQKVDGADLLYHEATYCHEDEKKASLYYHSTAIQAAEVALKANVGRLIIGHYSSRYEDENVLLDEARSVFPNTFLTHEMDIFEL